MRFRQACRPAPRHTAFFLRYVFCILHRCFQSVGVAHEASCRVLVVLAHYGICKCFLSQHFVCCSCVTPCLASGASLFLPRFAEALADAFHVPRGQLRDQISVIESSVKLRQASFVTCRVARFTWRGCRACCRRLVRQRPSSAWPVYDLDGALFALPRHLLIFRCAQFTGHQRPYLLEVGAVWHVEHDSACAKLARLSYCAERGIYVRLVRHV
jgi:hypothetical protein